MRGQKCTTANDISGIQHWCWRLHSRTFLAGRYSGWHARDRIIPPNFNFWRAAVLDSWATTGQTDGRTDGRHHSIIPLYREGRMITHCISFWLNGKITVLHGIVKGATGLPLALMSFWWLIMPRPIGWGIKRWWPSSVVHLSVPCLTLSQEQKGVASWKLAGRKVHDTDDPWPHLEVERSKSR